MDLEAPRGVVEPLLEPDPLEAFWRAHREHRPIALATSGTSSASRQVVRSTDSWVASFDACAQRLGLGPHSRFWVPGPLRATMNLFAACLASHVGASWGMEREGATHAQLTPTQLRVLLDADPPPGLHVLVAGDALSPALRERAEAAGLVVSHYYGAAELSLVAWGRDASSLRLFDAVEAEVRPLDDTGGTNPAPGPAGWQAGEQGVLWVRSPWLSHTATDSHGFASVGDLVRLDGDRLQVLGRPGAVTTAGATVQLAPIESLLADRATGPVAVLALPHPLLGSVLCAVTTADDRERLRGWARAHLDGARRPRRWVVRDALPTTPAGKLDRRALAEELARRAAEPSAPRPTRGTAPGGRP